MLQRGEVVTTAEAALVAGVGRATVHRWVKQAGINLKQARLRHVSRLHDRVQRQVEGKPMRQRMSKAAMRRMAEKAMRDFNRANVRI